jgi:hypothetical protein
MTAGEARERAAGLIAMAEHIELVNGPKHAPAPEAEPEPAKPKGRLAEMLGMAAPIEFTEERPGVWKTATPEDGERLDASIDEALASLGTSLAELRAAEKQDETPTVCAACDRTRPRWTMASSITDGKESFVCSPKFAMHCGVCCKPGESLTHYTEEEHRHGDALLDHADAERAARLEASLDPTDGGE